MSEHQIGDLVLGYHGYPGEKKKVLGVIKEVNDSSYLQYTVEWFSDTPATNASLTTIEVLKKHLREYIVKQSKTSSG